jgi:signal transduction histidine kinase
MDSGNQSSKGEENVLVCAPTGRDAGLLASTLVRERVLCEVFPSIEALCARMKEDAGAILVAEESLSRESMACLNQALSDQEAWSDIPLVVMTTGGETTMASLRVLKAFSPTGNVSLLERPFRPITLVSTLQVALRARRRQYQVRDLLRSEREATRIRDEFISIASHELKTPLTSLKLQAQLNQRLLARGQKDAFTSERIQKLIESTHQQVDRLARLVEDMLDVSRIGTGKLTVQKSEVDLSALVAEGIERFSPQLSAAGCPVETHITPDLIGVWDRYRIEQVISNLITNAIRYSPGRPIRISTERLLSEARLTVRDEGDGISPEDQERIFNRFERAVTSSNISGLGLGLYICRNILHAHDGRIRVHSVKGEGAAFIVELPLAEAAGNSPLA